MIKIKENRAEEIHNDIYKLADHFKKVIDSVEASDISDSEKYSFLLGQCEAHYKSLYNIIGVVK